MSFGFGLGLGFANFVATSANDNNYVEGDYVNEDYVE